MPVYSFAAKDSLGVSKSGVVEAISQQAALEVLKSQNLIVIDIKEKGVSLADKLLDFGGISDEDITAFTREFSTMISSGLPINKSIQILYEQNENKKFKKIIGEIAKDIDSGTSLSASFSRFPSIFDSSYVALLKAGESSGKLEEILMRLAETYEATRDLKSRLRAALTYPIIVIIVMLLVIIVLLVYVLPKLTEIFTSLNQQLPWHTRTLIFISNFFIYYWPVILVILVPSILFLRMFLLSEKGRMAFSLFVFRLPVIGKVVKQTELANYMRTLSLLVASGVQITEALVISSKVSSNPQIINASIEASKFVEKGSPLSDYLRSNTFFDPIIPSMVKIGEETGRIDELLSKVAENYSNESNYAIKGLSSSLEPIILVILGISVGSIVLSVITPIYSLVGSFSQ